MAFPIPTALLPDSLLSMAGVLGEALGRGVARGLSAGIPSVSELGARKRGRPAKEVLGVAPEGVRCKEPGCVRPSRAKGLCSAHYQAWRRKKMAKA